MCIQVSLNDQTLTLPPPNLHPADMSNQCFKKFPFFAHSLNPYQFNDDTSKLIHQSFTARIRVTSFAIDKMFEIFGPIFDQNANVNFKPIFEQNVNFGPIFD